MSGDHCETHEIKEEPDEYKEYPIDDINQEEPAINVSTLDTVNEIKDEPMEMKDELINNLKEEEPTVDIFCPSTGASRPVGGPIPVIEVPLQPDVQCNTCVVCLSSCNESEMCEFTTDPKKLSKWINDVRSSLEGRNALMELLNTTKRQYLCAHHFTPSDFNYFQSGAILKIDAVPFFEVLRRKCVVCHCICDVSEMHAFSSNDKIRPICVNAVRSTTEGRRSLMDLRNERADSRLCKIHFAISDKNGLPNDSVPSYVPYACLVCGEQFDWIADAKLHLMNNPGHRAPKKLINLNIPRHEVIPEQPKSQECDFCDEPELPYRLSPRDRTSAQRFFATLNAICASKSTFFSGLARICSNRFYSMPAVARPSVIGTTKSYAVKGSVRVAGSGMDRIGDFRSFANSQITVGNPKCDLCGEIAPPYRMSPWFPSVAKLFFAKLIELTPKQRSSIAYFLEGRIRARVCGRHFVKPEDLIRKITNSNKAESGLRVDETPIDDGPLSDEEPIEESPINDRPGPSRSR